MQSKLDTLSAGLVREESNVFVVAMVGNRIRASEAVAAWAFIRYYQTPEECTIRAVDFGGDTDTVGAMAGRWWRTPWGRMDSRPMVLPCATSYAERGPGALSKQAVEWDEAQPHPGTACAVAGLRREEL